MHRMIFHRWPTVFFVLVFFILVSLGCWQVWRYQQKTIRETTYQQAILGPPMPLLEMRGQAHLYKRIDVTGIFLNDATVLLHHRYDQHRLGVEVITPVKVGPDGKVIMVNRGWRSQADMNKPIPAIVGPKKLVGIRYVPQYQFILGDNQISAPGVRPYAIQRVNIAELENMLALPLYPFVLRLDNTKSNASFGFQRNWQAITTNPQKHLAYAVQWFLMALGISLVFAVYCMKVKPVPRA